MLQLLLKGILSFIVFSLFAIFLSFIIDLLNGEFNPMIDKNDLFIGVLGMLLFMGYTILDYESNRKKRKD